MQFSFERNPQSWRVDQNFDIVYLQIAKKIHQSGGSNEVVLIFIWTFDHVIIWSRVSQFDMMKISTYTKNAYKTFICTQFKSTRFDVFDLKIPTWSRKFFFESQKYPHRML